MKKLAFKKITAALMFSVFPFFLFSEEEDALSSGSFIEEGTNDDFSSENLSSASKENSSSLTETLSFPDETSSPSGETSVSSLTDDDYSTDLDISSLKVNIPSKKMPLPPDSEKLSEAEKRDEDGNEEKEIRESILYGTATEISSSIDKIIENEDPRFLEDLYELFYRTNTSSVKIKILEYFSKRKDPCLEDFAVEVLDDPYDSSNALVEKCLFYVSEVQTKEANTALLKILDKDDEKYFTPALTAIGKTGGKREAKYLADFLKRDDLEVNQRQALMRTLGQMNAVETWEDLVTISRDEDENAFVRMYAAEAIGNMKKEESIPVLIELYENGDPNMRQYCIKGLKNYPDNKKARNAIIQGIRDDHYKVRIEAIRTAKELQLDDASEYLIYRSKNDPENSVKKECYPALAELNDEKSKEYLLSLITDKKIPDVTKKMASEAILAKGLYGESEIVELAKEACKDDKRKDLRYALGKLFIKYARPAYAEACVVYLQSKDATTVSQGLELYKNARYEMATPSVKAVATDTKAKSSNRDRAKKLLGIEDEEDSGDSKDGTPDSKTGTSSNEK